MSESTNRRMSESANRQSTIGDAEEWRRRLGKLDPQQVAIWRQMTPARKLQLLFQMWHFARKIAWTTERQWHPDLTEEELSRRVWRRFHGREIPYVSTNRPT